MKDAEINDDTPCSSITVDSVVHIGYGLWVCPDFLMWLILWAHMAFNAVNAFIAAAVAGAAVGAGSRNWKQIAGLASVVSAAGDAKII